MRPTRKTRLAAIVIAALVIGILSIAVLAERSTPALSRWHTVTLQEEFRAGRAGEGLDWDGYLALEERLFAELDRTIVRPSAEDANPAWNRYAPGGPNNPAVFPTNWNRSFELPARPTRGGALAIHGLTDSPYSLRAVAEILNDEGFHVLGLRLPGHGTTPLALRQAEVEDWRAAVRMAYAHLVGSIGPDMPIILVGYSNGGALSLDLALDAVDDDSLRSPSRIVLFSPAIGITRAAALARIHRLVNWMPWFSRLGWGTIEPELDPFKYSSFPNDAGYLTHVLTRSVRARLAAIDGHAAASRFPPVLTFMSLADATVLVEAVVSGLHDRLVDRDSELVIFDINRRAEMRDFFRTDPVTRLGSLIDRETTPYGLTIISNFDTTTEVLEEWRRPAGASEPRVTPLDLVWPPGMYSLSHVAVPFPPDDPIYGTTAGANQGWGVQLGALEARGERGLLNIPADQLNRLRSNPFFPYIERRLIELTAVE
jgi:alpha-beta hydrolase superfamily lysophospholipase